MQFLDGRLIVSPSDLTGFLECEHLTQQELRAARGEIGRPDREDPVLDMLSRRGLEHEGRHLAGMGIGLADFDHSGRESLFVTNFSQQPNTLFKNQGGGQFLDVSLDSNLAMPHMPATGVSGVDLYVRADDGHWRWLANGRPTAQTHTARLVNNLPPGRR